MHNVEKRLQMPLNIPESCFVAPNAVIIGDVTFSENCSIWYNVVIRGDVEKIFIGKSTNIQDGAVVHVTKDLYSTAMGDFVTIGHNASLHGCKLGNNILVGIGAIILDNTEVCGNNLIAAGSLLPPGKKYPAGTLIKGSPAKAVRDLTEKEINSIKENAQRYVKYKDIYLKNMQTDLF